MIKPILCFVLSAALGIMSIYEKRSCRVILFIPCACLAFVTLTQIGRVTHDPAQASMLGMFLLIWVAHLANALFLQRISPTGASRSQKLHSAYKMLFNSRWLGTSRKAPCIPAEPTLQLSSNSYVQGFCDATASFVIKRAITAIFIYVLDRMYSQYIVMTQRPSLYQHLQFSDFGAVQQTYFRRLFSIKDPVTTRKTAIRTMMVIHFIWTAWSSFTVMHSIFASIFVAVGLDSPSDWPPLFGSLHNTFSIRTFWGSFWHRLVYRTYTSYAQMLSRKVRLRRNSRMERVLVYLLVFLASGSIHSIVNWQLGMCAWWTDIPWFLMNAVALGVESISIAIGSQILPMNVRGHWARKLLGHLWVFSFLFWSLPKAHYPKVYCTKTEV